MGVLLASSGIFFIKSEQIYSANFIIGVVAGPIAIIAGLAVVYITIFKWDIFQEDKTVNSETTYGKYYKRIILGSIIGFMALALPTSYLLYQDGWFHRVPCFTPPPGLIILNIGFVGVVIGALLSMFSKKWHSQNNPTA
ncbi:MAG: hypothetical protein WC633_01245 [Desulfurivibrionaceae bacterium]